MIAAIPRVCLFALLECFFGCARVSSNGASPEQWHLGGVEFAGIAHIENVPSASPKLIAFAGVRNNADTVAVIDSEQSNCEPALQFLQLATGRRFVWSHAAWRQRHDVLSPPPLASVVCVGTGLLVTLPPRGTGEIARQAYPLSMIRGDSMPPGAYRISIPVIVSTVRNGTNRDDTLHVWSPPITLP